MTSAPNTLAMELSQREGSIAVSNRSGQVVCRETLTGRRDADDVMPSIATATEELGIAPEEIDLVVVSVGPGGFTGLRTSIAIAKMVSLVSGAKIVPVESAIVVASESGRGNGPFLAVSGVKQESFWLSRVACQDGTWSCESGLATVSTLGQHTKDMQCVFADSFLPESARSLLCELDISVYPLRLGAKTLLEVGLTMHAQGVHIDPADLLPIYPREPEAVRKWNAKPEAQDIDR